uniref:Uncharacterized protein n=1 Tax=Sander lucioperca TaxID=283035 RepID=A0A8C9YFZ0_SANLU
MEQPDRRRLKWYPPRRFGGSRFLMCMFFISAFVVFSNFDFKKFTRDVGYNESCYVCSLFPHSQKQATPVKPHSLNLTEVICALTALKDVRKEGGQYFSASYQPSPCEGFASRSVHAPNGTMFTTKNEKASDSIGQFHHSLMKTLSHALCFERPRRAGSRYLGVTTGCQQTLNCTCATGDFDISACLDSTPGYLNASVLDTSLTHMMRWPDDSGAGSLVDFVWLCGDHWYQILTPLWAGRCSVIYLTPSITVMTSLILENLTAIMISGFGELPPAIRAMRNMLMQHQMGLDLLLAAQGGLCHIIGTHCCTFIPDIEGNITDTVHHLNLLLTNLKAQDVPEQDAGWDWWAWAFEGGWKAWLARFVAPAITLLFGFLICICCVIPLIKKMISSIFMVNMVQYQALQDTESSNLFHLSGDDNIDDDNASDTV